MEWISKFQLYIPILVSLIAAFLGYALGIRTRKVERFYNQVNENLREISSPIFHELRFIMRISNPSERFNKIKIFFEKYTKEDSNIYKLGDKYLIEWFYETEELFFVYSKYQSEELLNQFWIKFDRLYVMISNNYWANFDSNYREFRWMSHIWKRNYLFRFYYEGVRITLETFKFLALAVIFIAYLSMFTAFTGHPILPKDFVFKFILLSLFIFMGLGLTVMLGSHYLTLTTNSRKKSRVRKFFERCFPKLMLKWDKYLGDVPEWVVKKIQIPKMPKIK